MKSWLRLTLITVTVGGGFTGVALTLQAIVNGQLQRPFNYVLMMVFLALFAFVTAAGLIFVHNPQRTTPLIVALALQIPWVSSPIITYKFTAGFQLSAALIDGRFNGGFRLGSDFVIYIFQKLPWGAGANFFAAALLVLLLRATHSSQPLPQPTLAPHDIAAPENEATSSASGMPPINGGTN